MSSSPTRCRGSCVRVPAPVPPGRRPGGLLAVLASVPDPRARRGVRHRVVSVLAISVAAVLAGARAYAVIAEWAGEQSDRGPGRVRGARAGCRPRPRSAGCSPGIDAAVLAAAVGAFVWTRTTVAEGRRVIAIDGKSLRGAGGADGVMPHLVAALDHATGTVLAQLATTAKSNEIPTVRTLLQDAGPDRGGGHDRCHAYPGRHRPAHPGRRRRLPDDGQGQPAQAARDAQGDALEQGPVLTRPPTRGRGRRITRTIKVLQAPTDLAGWADFPGAAQVAQIRRTRTSKTKTRQPEEDRRGRLRDHLRRPPHGTATHAGRVGPAPLADRVPALDPRRRLRRRPQPDPHRHRRRNHGHPTATPRSACSAWPAGPPSPPRYATTNATPTRSLPC